MAEVKLLEFCSAEWVAHAGDYLRQAAADADLAGVNIAFNEVFTDAPEHLDADEQGRIGWYLRVSDGDIKVARGVLTDADFRIIGDYETMVPLARLVHTDNPENTEKAARLSAEAATAGKIRLEGDQRVLAALDWMMGLHDEMAVRTA